MRHLYLAATGQNRGKTTASLGLLEGFLRRGLKAGFMKPVGQRTVIDDGDAGRRGRRPHAHRLRLPEPYSVMSPVHIPRGFTKAYIAGEVVEDLGARIATAHASFAEPRRPPDRGHRARRRRRGHRALERDRRGAPRRPAIIVSEGGVGRPIDEIVLNASLFASRGVEVAGAIVNKVDVKAQPGIPRRPRARASPATASRCSGSCRSARSSRTRPSR